MYFYDDFYDESYQNPLPVQTMNAVPVENGCYPMGYSPIQQFQPYNSMQPCYGTNPYCACPGSVPYNPNGDGGCSSGFSSTQKAVAASIMKHRQENETIDRRANLKVANDVLKSGLKRQEMHEKAELDEKAMEKKAEIDKEKIVLKEDLRLKKENAVIVVVKNP